MTKSKQHLKDDPQAKAYLDQAIVSARMAKAQRPSITGIRKLLATPETKEAMTMIIDTSSMNDAYKKFIKMVFVEGMSKEGALHKMSHSLGRDLDPAVKNETINSILQHPDVKDFLEMLKLWYVQVAPVAALTEVDIMLNMATPPDVRLRASQSVLKRAGLGDEEDKNKQLPVQVNILMPQPKEAQPLPEIKIVEPIKNGQ